MPRLRQPGNWTKRSFGPGCTDVPPHKCLLDFVIIGDKTRTGTIEDGDRETESRDLLIEAHGGDEIHGDGERLLAFAGEHNLALLSTFFATPNMASRTIVKASTLEKVAFALTTVHSRRKTGLKDWYESYLSVRLGSPNWIATSPLRRSASAVGSHLIVGNESPRNADPLICVR